MRNDPVVFKALGFGRAQPSGQDRLLWRRHSGGLCDGKSRKQAYRLMPRFSIRLL